MTEYDTIIGGFDSCAADIKKYEGDIKKYEGELI